MPVKSLDGAGRFFQACLFIVNVIVFAVGATLLAVAAWIIDDKNCFTPIVGNVLYEVAAWILCVGGAVLLLLAFFGCFGAFIQNKVMLIIYFLVLLLLFVLLITAGVLAIIFNGEIGEEVKQEMRENLMNYYGKDQNDAWNRRVTNCYDKIQEEEKCCAVEDQGWLDYKSTEWYESQPPSFEGFRPLVPRSCCVKEDGDYVDLNHCQNNKLGPPSHRQGNNNALYFRGCYSVGKDFLNKYSNIMTGLGIGSGLFLFFGMMLSMCLYRKINY